MRRMLERFIEAMPFSESVARLRVGFHETIQGEQKGLVERHHELAGPFSFHFDAISLDWPSYLDVFEPSWLTHRMEGTVRAPGLASTADMAGTLSVRFLRRRTYYDFAFTGEGSVSLRFTGWRAPGPTWLLPKGSVPVHGHVELVESGQILAQVEARVVRAGLLSPRSRPFKLDQDT